MRFDVIFSVVVLLGDR